MANRLKSNRAFAAAAALVAACLALSLPACANNEAPAGDSAAPATDQAAVGETQIQDAGVAESQDGAGAASGADASQGQQSGNQAGGQDLSWRDTDFAVDPNRTDWNYEPNGRKVVYLTIDDGPSEKTQAVLDILDTYGCKATFFVVGHNPDYFPMIKEAYDRGHTIGLHTYSHDYAWVYSSVDAYYSDLAEIGQVVADQIGYVPCFIRFPGGSSNAISADYSPGIMSTLVESVQMQGYQYYDWNLSVGDGSEHTTDEIVGYGTEPTGLDNIVLLCHDSETKQTTVEALPRIIEHYQALGYTFEALDRSAMVPHHGVYN